MQTKISAIWSHVWEGWLTSNANALSHRRAVLLFKGRQLSLRNHSLQEWPPPAPVLSQAFFLGRLVNGLVTTHLMWKQAHRWVWARWVSKLPSPHNLNFPSQQAVVCRLDMSTVQSSDLMPAMNGVCLFVYLKLLSVHLHNADNFWQRLRVQKPKSAIWYQTTRFMGRCGWCKMLVMMAKHWKSRLLIVIFLSGKLMFWAADLTNPLIKGLHSNTSECVCSYARLVVRVWGCLQSCYRIVLFAVLKDSKRTVSSHKIYSIAVYYSLPSSVPYLYCAMGIWIQLECSRDSKEVAGYFATDWMPRPGVHMGWLGW